MDPTNKSKPRIFVSSTIYDFRDLRSALKMWLEDFGFETLMSEMNDFRQMPDQNSYPSCLQAIDGCDYFILLIGGRVGGWYDKSNRLSITQMEYRHAYERLKEGRLKLLVFVRKEIWDVREDREALKNYLGSEHDLDKELSDEQKTKVVNHPSKFLNDANFIIDFLAEVARVPEMKNAVIGNGEFPIGNWVYQFSTFKDIIDACRTVHNLSGNLRHKAIIANLKHELALNLKELLTRSGKNIVPITTYSKHARAHLKGGFSGSSEFTGKHLIWLGMFFGVWGNVGKRLKMTAITEAITSGEFLEYDKTYGTLKVGPLQKALMDLEGQIERLRAINSKDVIDLTMNQLVKDEYKNHLQKTFTIENSRFLMLFAVHDIIDNIIIFSKAIYLNLEGKGQPIASLKVNPSSPLQEENENMDAENVSHDETLKWLNS